ncbi:IS982 family transposase [Flavivirga aquimarina]|uniref:IS982 family transposase n=1 Tax=Flavivirga aquimarina TaxID=2027862 RepID=A0ABT8WEV1_9FLAO|nr:IS982 family transposase [Flavivirga aquimarina]MDO5971531.1 IS982 family transposase [Flavivirga aquimarina]
MLRDKITEFFVELDDFCNEFSSQLKHVPVLESSPVKSRNRHGKLSDSEMMSIYLLFHYGQFTNFKHFYTQYVCKHLGDLFPNLISYVRFNARQERILLPLMLYLKYKGLGKSRGINYIDSTLLRVCHIKREKQHRVFKGVASKGKSTMGWFFGFKLHLIVNDRGELLSFYLTKGNVDDRNIDVMSAMTKDIFGKLFGDRGYISKALAELLFQDGIQLITKIRKNMKQQNLSDVDAILLRKRALVESVNDELKNICKIEHTRHRSVKGFLVNLISGLTAYCFFPKKPSLNITPIETNQLCLWAA